jgi:hypothetical protein
MGTGWLNGVNAIGSSPRQNRMAARANDPSPSVPCATTRYCPMAIAVRLIIM